MSAFISILTTTGTREDAQRIAASLVERKLAACAQTWGPIDSTYRWAGAIESAQEWCCAIKTRASLFDRVAQAIAELHAYETPEIVAYPIVAAGDAYLAWLDAELEPDPS